MKTANQAKLPRRRDDRHSVLVSRALSAIGAKAKQSHIRKRQATEELGEEIQYQGRRLAKLGLSFDEVRARLQPRRLAALGEGISTLIEFHLSEAFHQVREAESQAYLQMFRAEVEAANPAELMTGAVQALIPYAQADAGRAWLLDRSGFGWQCIVSVPSERLTPRPQELPHDEGSPVLREPECLNGASNWEIDRAWSQRFVTRWRIPILSGSELFGLIELGFKRKYEWLPRERELLLAASRLCASAVKRALLLDQLITVEEAERRRISRDLHDEAGQSLMYLRLQLEMLDRAVTGDGSLRGMLTEARNSAEHAAEEIRRILASLSPSALEQLGLCPALRQLLKRFRALHAIGMNVTLPGRVRLPDKMEIVVYRIFQELLNNVAKHAQATQVNVRLEVADKQVTIEIEDNGKGFEVGSPGERRDCFGLKGLRDRAGLFGGTVQVTSCAKPDRGAARRRPGTSVRVQLPLPRHISEG